MLDTPAGGIVGFSVFEIDLRSGELRKRGVRVPLQQQPFRILVRLLERPSELVTRERLREELWSADTYVDFEQGLNAAVKRLRVALGDSAQTPRFIETLPKRGYRFIGSLNLSNAAPRPTIATETHEHDGLQRIFLPPQQITSIIEIVDEVTLGDRLAAGMLDIAETCEIGAQVADALSAAHAAGLIHHDITPRSILLTTDGRAKLADFGLSRAIDPERMSLESARTSPGLAGTVHYLSPEQIRGEACTPRTDVFSFGSVLYHAATGQRPFDGVNQAAVLDAISTADPPLPSTVRHELPPIFDTLLRRLLTKPVEDRTIELAEVAHALRSLKASLPAQAITTTSTVHEPTRDKPPFVGRARELAQLTAALSRAVAGEGTTIVITGDAGLGKTALLEAFLRERQTLVANVLVCRGQSVEHSGAGEPYLPVIDALAPTVAYPGQGLHDIIHKYAPSWRSQFPGAYPREDVASIPPTTERLARELGDALSAAARSRPLVMILEDLHWADPSTVELLRYLAHRAARAPLLLIASCRQEEAATAGCPINQNLAELEARGVSESVELSLLDEAAIREYLQRRFGLLEEVLPPLTSLLFNATEGHPLFLVSLVQLFIQRGDLRHLGHVWQLSTPVDRLRVVIPRTVEAVIRRKLAALEDADRRLLQHASIEGHEFSTAILSALIGDDSATLEERLERLAKGPRIVDVLGPERYVNDTWGARYRFAHALYHSLVYEDLAPSRRANLHRQAGERLAALNPGRTTAVAAQLARHFKEGRDWNRAFDYYVQAGDNSTTLSAATEAEGHYSQAIGLARAEGTQIEPRRIAMAHYKRAITRVVLGNSLLAMSDYHEALIGTSNVGDDDLAFDIRLARAYTHVIAERIDEAIKSAADLEKDAEPPPGGSKRLRCLILDVQLKMSRGDLDQAALSGDTAISLARALGDRQRLCAILSVRAKFDYYRADYQSALTRLREVCSSPEVGTRRHPDPRPRYTRFDGILFLGRTLVDLGRISEALRMLQSELEIARADGYVYWVPIFLNAIGWVYGEVGELEAALRHAEDATAETVGQNSEVRVQSRLLMAMACSRLGHLDRAASLLGEAGRALEQGVPYGWLWRIHFSVIAAEHALARGAQATAADLAREGAALARGYGVWRHVVIAERLQAEAATADGDWSCAGAHVQKAFDILTAYPVPILSWEVHAVAARIHWHSGRHAEAAEARDRARSEVRQLSERIYEEKLKAAFLGSHAVRQVVSGSGWD